MFSDAYDPAVKLLDLAISKKKKVVASAVELALEQADISGGLPELKSRIIAPMQRIPRYKLLVSRMMDSLNSEADADTVTADLTDLTTALNEVSRIANVVNDALYTDADMKALAKVASRVVTTTKLDIVKPGRRVSLAHRHTSTHLDTLPIFF